MVRNAPFTARVPPAWRQGQHPPIVSAPARRSYQYICIPGRSAASQTATLHSYHPTRSCTVHTLHCQNLAMSANQRLPGRARWRRDPGRINAANPHSLPFQPPPHAPVEPGGSRTPRHRWDPACSREPGGHGPPPHLGRLPAVLRKHVRTLLTLHCPDTSLKYPRCTCHPNQLCSAPACCNLAAAQRRTRAMSQAAAARRRTSLGCQPSCRSGCNDSYPPLP